MKPCHGPLMMAGSHWSWDGLAIVQKARSLLVAVSASLPLQ